MRKFFTNVSIFFTLLWHSLLRGMKNADNTLTTSTKINGENADINEVEKGGGVFADMLEMKVTKEVEELRDKNYRVLREADRYKTNITFDSDGNIINATASKKDVSEYMIHPNVLIEENEKLMLIQDNFKTPKPDGDPRLLYNTDTTIKIKRDGYKSRFDIEQFASKLVIKSIKGNDNTRHIDIYTSLYASQFGKIDAILIANLNELLTNKSTKCDFLEFDGLEFVTDRPWPFGVNKKYEYKNIVFTGIDVFDGSFVLHFDCTPALEDFDLTEKYKTKELTEKYEKEAPVHEDVIDMDALYRKMKKEKKNEITKLGTETFKLS